MHQQMFMETPGVEGEGELDVPEVEMEEAGEEEQGEE